jgi:hypothetical protein
MTGLDTYTRTWWRYGRGEIYAPSMRNGSVRLTAKAKR